MRKFSVLSVLALGAMATTAQAQGIDLAPGVTLTGDAKLNFVHVAGESMDHWLEPDLTLAWRAQGDSDFSIGAEAIIDSSYNLSAGDHYSNPWAAVVLGFGMVDLKVGAPRPVISAMKPMAQIEYDGITGSLITAASHGDGGMTPGVALQGQTSDVMWGLSYHEIDKTTHDDRSFEAVGVYNIGSTSVFGAVQLLNGDGYNEDNYEIGVLYYNGMMGLGLRAGRDNLLNGTDFGEFQLGYQVNPAISLQSSVMRITGSKANLTLLSLGAEYNFGNGGYMQTNTKKANNDQWESYEFALGWRF